MACAPCFLLRGVLGGCEPVTVPRSSYSGDSGARGVCVCAFLMRDIFVVVTLTVFFLKIVEF